MTRLISTRALRRLSNRKRSVARELPPERLAFDERHDIEQEPAHLARVVELMPYVNRSTREAEYGAFTLYREALRVALLKIMADNRHDALVYATFDAQSPVIPEDILTNARVADKYFRGDNRPLSALLAWPALTVPMGLTVDSMPAGLEFLGRAFSEPRLLGFAFAYEQGTKHRRPPSTTPTLAR